MPSYEEKLNSKKPIADFIPNDHSAAEEILLALKNIINEIKQIEENFENTGVLLFSKHYKNLEGADTEESNIKNMPLSDCSELLSNLKNSLQKTLIEQRKMESNQTSLQNQKLTIKDQLSTISEKINSNSLITNNLAKEISQFPQSLSSQKTPRPSKLDRFLADNNPGGFKSLILRLLSQFYSVAKSKNRCDEYDLDQMKQQKQSNTISNYHISIQEKRTLDESHSDLNKRYTELVAQESRQGLEIITYMNLSLKLDNSINNLKKNIAQLLGVNDIKETLALNKVLDSHYLENNDDTSIFHFEPEKPKKV